MKFSFEDKIRQSSTFGFVRRIPMTFWLALLRELAYLNTLAEVSQPTLRQACYFCLFSSPFLQCVSTSRLGEVDRLSRLRCFHHFMETKFLPFYSAFSASSQSFYQPLFEKYEGPRDRQEARREKITRMEQLRGLLKRELCHLFDYDGLTKAFTKWSMERTIPVMGEATGQKVKVMTISKFLNYLLVSYPTTTNTNLILVMEHSVS